MSPNPDLTLVINAHREGILLYASLRSAAEAVEHARKAGVNVRTVVVADRPDEETLNVIKNFDRIDGLHVMTIDAGDLGLARNAAVEFADSSLIAFFDGDDLISRNWLAEAVERARKEQEDSFYVIRPEMSFIFGGNEPYLHCHISTTAPEFKPWLLLVHNYWTAITLAPVSLHREFPFKTNDTEGGYAYEDWSWNVETVAAGVPHITVQDTCIFVRRKTKGSLLQLTNSNQCLPRLSPLLSRPNQHVGMHE